MISYNKEQKDGGNQIRVNQMYSQALTNRMNEALKERKELIQNNKYKEYILAYPAKRLA